MDILQNIAAELQINRSQVETVINLFNEDATVPFIARYRKEKTGGLDEDELRLIEERHNYLQLLESRKETVLKTIEEQGKLSDELRMKIVEADKLQEVEDLYLPYRPKRKTRGTIAKAKGLEPLANFILENPYFEGDFSEELNRFVDAENGVNNNDEALQGAKDIIAEKVSETAEIRQLVREFISNKGSINSKKAPVTENHKNKKDNYEVYHDFQIDVRLIKPYQLLAINRGEREKFLRVSFGFDGEAILNQIYNEFVPHHNTVFEDILVECIKDGFDRLIMPSIDREIRKELTEAADLHAIEIFASNLKQLLLMPPMVNKIIMGIDPGFVSGSKIAIIDETGKYLEGKTIYPHPPQKKVAEASATILSFIRKYDVDLIAIGNGTASRETELLVANLIQQNSLDCHYLITNEAGASVYSASPIAKEEFPELEASMRGNISIARRVLDPLAELVKIDPKSIGVGLYQHDVEQKLLSKKLDDVVISSVNYVGVDLNTASSSLLKYVSGLNKKLATSIVNYREKNGKFSNRNQLLKVTGIGAKAFEQSAGFLKIQNSENPFDNTFIHPESYEQAEKLLTLCNISVTEINSKGQLVQNFVNKTGLAKIADEIGVGNLTLEDIVANIQRPGRDPREEMPVPILRSDVLKMEDLEENMVLKGTVRNVVDFGAFVDIGVKQDGLLHISQMANKFVKNPLEILSVGDVIDVTILAIDVKKGRISLSIKN